MLGRVRSFAWLRTIAAAALSFFFCVAGLTPLAAAWINSSNCTMVCCKMAKAACHRSGHGESHSSRWTSSPECPKGCGQSLAMPGSAGASLAAGGAVHGASLHATGFSIPGLKAWTRPGTEFSLFERPPPFLS
jgi:hypothetical protein